MSDIAPGGSQTAPLPFITKGVVPMKEEFYVERIVRIVAGSFVMISLLLAHFHSPNWLWFTGFVGLNLFQSGFTQFCPMFNILQKMGVPRFPKSSCCK
jgi:hypothetical protein